MKPKAITNLNLDRAIVNRVDAVDDYWNDFAPRGLCATGCGHQATDLFVLYRGPSRYDFRCKCCIARAACDRALKAIEDLPALEAAYHEIEATCGKGEA